MRGSLDNLVADWTPEMRSSVDATWLWLKAYYSNAQGDLVFATPHRRSWRRHSGYRLFDCDLRQVAAAVNGQAQLYLKINTMNLESIAARGPWAVGGNKEIVQIVSFHADIDCEKRLSYPTRSQANSILRSLSMPPSMIVGSGGALKGGLHPSWILDIPVFVGDRLEFFKQLSRRFQAFLKSAFAPHDTDELKNLERVLRVPGSFRKDGERVALMELNNRRYSLDDILSLCPPIEDDAVEPGASKSSARKKTKSPSGNRETKRCDNPAISNYLKREGITLESLLLDNGWKIVGQLNGQNQWRRPHAGADATPISALQGISKHGRPGIWNFSGNAGIRADEWHDAEAVFVHYRFKGNWTDAAAFCHDQLNYEHIYIEPRDPQNEIPVAEWRELQKEGFQSTIIGLNIERSPMGTGKTAAALKMIASGKWGPTVFCCSTHANCIEIKRSLDRLRVSSGLYPTVSKDNCIRSADATRAMSVGLPIVSTVCADCPNNLPDELGLPNCTYHRLRRLAEKEPNTVCTHARLVHGNVASAETIVIDENALSVLRKVVSLTSEQIVEARAWWQKSGLVQSDACMTVCDVLLNAISNGGSAHQRVTIPPLAIESDGWHQALWSDKSAPHLSAVAVLKLAVLDYAEVGACYSNAVIVFGNEKFIGKRLIYLDATADVELLKRALYRETNAGVDISVMMPVDYPIRDLTPSGMVAIAQRPIQLPTLDITIGTDPEAKAKRIARYIVTLIGEHDYQRVSVIGHSKHVRLIKKYVPAAMQWRLLDFCYFREGPDRGSNYWHDTRCDCLLIAGTPRVPESAIRDQLAAFGYWGVSLPSTVKCKVHVGKANFVTRRYADPVVQGVFEYLVRSTLLQAIGRARPLQDKVRCDTYVLSNLVLETWYPEIGDPEQLAKITDTIVSVAEAVAMLIKNNDAVAAKEVEAYLNMHESLTRRALRGAAELKLVAKVGERSGYRPSKAWYRGSVI